MRGARLWFLSFILLTPILAIDCEGPSYNAALKASCANGILDGSETDIDCGGNGCPACSSNEICSVDLDCGATLTCRSNPIDTTGTKRCFPMSCLDSKLEADETDVDCGGVCLPCTAGQRCGVATDCDSSVCASGVCSLASCSDGRQNQDESDLDCGSVQTAAYCLPCVAGQKCLTDENCDSRLCKAGICQSPSCDDSRKNGGEGDVDCGGSCKARCAEGAACNAAADCGSGVCLANVCMSALCADGVLNGGESAIDCGGPCGSTCQPGRACGSDADCATGFCSGKVCLIPSCTDGTKNQGESDIDCGDARGTCPRCATARTCSAPASCKDGICTDGRCAERSCFDQVKNGTEGDIDCGGDCAARCKDGRSCIEMSDCASGVCKTGICAEPTCGDGVMNGLESGPDCGGATCTNRCEIGVGCVVNSDCKINSCAAGRCADPLCNNSMADGSESDVDCGGDRCGKCSATKKCIKDADCLSSNCVGLVCVAETCSDRIQNGRETSVDCGGDCPNKCAVNQACGVGTDCVTGVCSAGRCVAPHCDDQVKNGLETDTDCGGADCVALATPRLCSKGQGCDDDTDCKVKLICDAAKGKCVDWSCTDLRKNQDETDVDCGGTTCSGCATGRACRAASDCKDRLCTNGVCAAPRCDDKLKNGSEGDVDCGGICSTKCPNAGACNLGTDCESGVCSATSPQLCQAPTCTDKVKNQDETDADCGGSCSTKCGDGKNCKLDADCANQVSGSTCKMVGEIGICTPPGCADKAINGDETDIDCGGSSCGPCAAGKTCKLDRDCVSVASGKCVALVCAAPSCSDLVQNGAESDTDCGGAGAPVYPVCKACATGQKCAADGDCESDHCVGNACQAPTCIDGTKNGGEMGVDCGAVCEGQKTNPGCPDASPCNVDGDCAGGWCKNNVCTARTCSDGVANGAEGDVDCGAICPSKPCALGSGCKIDADCATGATCSECLGKCIKLPKSCYIASSTDTSCYRCADGQACSNDTDCLSLNCDATGHCGAVDSCIGGLLNDADGRLSDGTVICNTNSSERNNCYGFLRCLFANNCTITDACFTPPTDVKTPCGYNVGIGSATAYSAAASSFTKAGCVAPTNP
jgi:hypothetical protein